VQAHELYMPMNSTESPVKRLTGSHTDPLTHTPAYKDTSVEMRVLPEIGESSLPKTNHRFGHPTPQRGVEVESATPGFFSLLQKFSSKDSRRAMGAAAELLENVGKV
jgi:predicted molibdopterin-dependent oxidoreductase YjgC